MGQAQVCCDESQETRPPQVATFIVFLLSPTARSHFATMQSGFFDSLTVAMCNGVFCRDRVFLLDSVYMRLSQNSQPNSDTPDMNSRKER